MKRKHKIVLLDLGGVVFESTGISNDLIHWEVVTELNYKYGYQMSAGEDLFETFLIEYNQKANQQLSGPAFLEAIFDTLQFNRELVDLIRKDYPIYIVSDNYRENIAYISQRFHFSDWAEKQFYSYDFGLLKTDKEFFKLLLDQLEESPEELLFIDDSKSKIDNAAEYGIQGIQFQNNAQVASALELLR